MLESSADTLLLDAILDATNADVAFANGWRYGAPIPAGPITVEAISNLAPMDTEISLAELSGTEILQMMEENLERTFSREPFGQMGGYVKRCAGMRIYFKVENPRGTRVQKIFIGGEELDGTRVYRAAYITSQAVPVKFGSNHRLTGIRLLQAVATYLNQGNISEIPTGSFMEV
jgi:2',3'-cyclic-nucleotide 2'-phosphodiesterase (5'-nucleotidase family)